MVVMNLALIGFLYYSDRADHLLRQREIELLYESHNEIAQILATCGVK